MEQDNRKWVFGYGSLMWNPGFAYVHREKACAYGVERRFCIYSYHYRGTTDKPGLVLGLSPGEKCEGIAFEVAHSGWEETLSYLRQREQITMVYKEVWLPLTLSSGQTITALSYVADESHEQYAGHLEVDTQVSMILNACGENGTNQDYALNTHQHLTEEDIQDHYMDKVCQALQNTA